MYFQNSAQCHSAACRFTGFTCIIPCILLVNLDAVVSQSSSFALAPAAGYYGRRNQWTPLMKFQSYERVGSVTDLSLSKHEVGHSIQLCLLSPAASDSNFHILASFTYIFSDPLHPQFSHS